MRADAYLAHARLEGIGQLAQNETVVELLLKRAGILTRLGADPLNNLVFQSGVKLGLQLGLNLSLHGGNS